jgi:glutathione S-transferase
VRNERVVLNAISFSHPAMAVELMLKHKQASYRRVDLTPFVHRLTLRRKGFPAGTVPAIEVAGRRAQGSRRISRELDQLFPEHPLFPADAATRAEVEAAERYGEELVQYLARRLLVATAFATGAKAPERLPDPVAGLEWGGGLGSFGRLLLGRFPMQSLKMIAIVFGITPSVTRSDLELLPVVLDRLDELVDRGVIGGSEPNAADFQLAPSLRLMMAAADIEAGIRDRPIESVADLCPAPQLRFEPGVLDIDWSRRPAPAPVSRSSPPRSRQL